MQISTKKVFILISISAILSSCASTKVKSLKVDTGPEFGDNIMHETLSRFKKNVVKMDCRKPGIVTVAFTVSKNKKIKYPIVHHSLSPNCKKALTETIKKLEVISPAIKDGKPTSAVYKWSFRIKRDWFKD